MCVCMYVVVYIEIFIRYYLDFPSTAAIEIHTLRASGEMERAVLVRNKNIQHRS